MSIFTRYCLLLFCILLLLIDSTAQKNFKVEIAIPKSINPSSLQICYDNGREKYKPVQFKVENGIISLNGEYSSLYATIMLHYTNNADIKHYYTSFWVSDKPAVITIDGIDDTRYSSLKSGKLINAISVKKEGEEALDKFVANESKKFELFYSLNLKNFHKKDSLIKLQMESHKRLTYKKIEFAKRNSNLYYSFWLFRKDIGLAYSVPSDTLIKLYKTIFPDSLKKTDEGELVLEAIKTKPLKINTIAPNFITKDIANNFIIRDKLKSEYTLIAFWATWCKPCVEEIPHIKDLRNRFSSDKLSIISVTRDDNYLSFLKAVRKYDMKWTHIFGDEELIKMFNVTAIPQVYLINKNGEVKYKISGYDPLDLDFNNLTKILEKDSEPTAIAESQTMVQSGN